MGLPKGKCWNELSFFGHPRISKWLQIWLKKRAPFWLKSGPNFFQTNWRKTNHKFWNHSRLFSLMITVISSLFSLVLCAKNEYVLITIAGNTIFEVQNYKYFSQKFASDFCFKKFGKIFTNSEITSDCFPLW